MNKGNVDYDYITTPFAERVAKFMHLPYPFAWVLISFCLFGIHYGAGRLAGEPLTGVWGIIVVVVLPALLAVSVIWFSKVLEQFTPSLFMFIDAPKEETLAWYEGEVRAIFTGKWVYIAAMLMAILMGVVSFFVPQSPLKTLPRFTHLFIYVVMGFMAGIMIHTMARSWVMIYKLGTKDNIKVSVYQHPLTSVKAVGMLLGKMALAIIAIYAFGISYNLSCEPNLLVVVTSVVFGFFVLWFFIVPQIAIHKIMAKVKYRRLMNFSEHLEDALQLVTTDPSRNNIERVRELFEVQRSLVGMGEWPFNTGLLLVIITGIAVPILVVFIQFVCNKFL